MEKSLGIAMLYDCEVAAPIALLKSCGLSQMTSFIAWIG
jgi:hypothetical protein